MRVLRAAVVLGVSTPLAVLACGSDKAVNAVGAGGAAGNGNEGGDAGSGVNTGGSLSLAGTGGGANGGAPMSDAGAGGLGGGDAAGEGGGAGASGAPGAAGASGAAGAAGGGNEPDPVCGDAATSGGLVCFKDPSTLSLVEGTPTDVAIGDWNGASGLDVIVGSNGVTAYFPNDGTGALGSESALGASVGSAAVLGSAQLDSVGNHVDLLLAPANSGTSAIHFGNGQGAIASTEGSAFGSEGVLFNYFVADLAGSPVSDDLVVTFNNSISVVPTTGLEGEGFLGPVATFAVAAQDAVLAKLGSSQWLVYSTLTNVERKEVTYAAGSVTLGALPLTTPAGGTAGQLDVGDFNEDDVDDVVVTLSDKGSLSVLFGDGLGTGGFKTVVDTTHFLSLTIGSSDADKTQRDVKVGDFNGDQHADIAVSVQGLDAIAIFSGDGAGAFSGPKLLSTGAGSGPTRLAVGDLNADGVDDLAVLGVGSSKVIVLLSDP